MMWSELIQLQSGDGPVMLPNNRTGSREGTAFVAQLESVRLPWIKSAIRLATFLVDQTMVGADVERAIRQI